MSSLEGYSGRRLGDLPILVQHSSTMIEVIEVMEGLVVTAAYATRLHPLEGLFGLLVVPGYPWVPEGSIFLEHLSQITEGHEGGSFLHVSLGRVPLRTRGNAPSLSTSQQGPRKGLRVSRSDRGSTWKNSMEYEMELGLIQGFRGENCHGCMKP